VAPYTGDFKLLAGSWDMTDVIVGGAGACDQFHDGACVWLSVPNDYGGGWSLFLEEGQAFFITFHVVNPSSEGGTVAVSITPWDGTW
jgi:hypothetical protein